MKIAIVDDEQQWIELAKKQVMEELQTVDTYKTVMMPIINKISKWYKREINFDPFANLEKRFGRLTQEDYLKLIKQEELGVDLNGNLISQLSCSISQPPIQRLTLGFHYLVC